MNTAIKWGKLTRNVADGVDIPHAEHTEIQIWDETEVTIFLTSARSSLYYPLFHLALYSGARRGELLALRWQDVDLIAGQLSISRSLSQSKDKSFYFKQPKTKTSRRTIALSRSAILVLKQHRESTEHQRSRLGQIINDSDLIFSQTLDNRPLRPATVSKAWESEIKKAGVKVIRFHDARHTHASLLLKAGVPLKVVSERLGHSSIAITADIYSHILPGMQEAAAQRFDELISNQYNNKVPENIR